MSHGVSNALLFVDVNTCSTGW